MKNRIKEIRKSIPEYGKTQETFAEYLGISKQNLASYETGRRTPSDAVIQLICQKCNIDEEWLRSGTGEMNIKKNIIFGDICADIGANDPKAKEAIMKYYELTEEDKKLWWTWMERFLK